MNFKFCYEICDYNYDECSIKNERFFPLSKSNNTIYSYELNSDLDELKDKNKNSTFIYLSPETIQQIKRQFNLDENEKLSVMISDYPTENSQKATNDYNYRIFLENGTELNLSKLNEDIYTEVYTPIKDLDLAKFEYTKEFAKQGFDIYDKDSEFYNDICTSASVGGNDITVNDRKNDVYPKNVTFCKDNCVYNGVNIEEQRIICKCNLNINNKEEEEKEEEEDNGNYITYLLDNINYKIFQCYQLLSVFDNLKNNYAFYVIAGVFLVLLIIDLLYFTYIIPKLRMLMLKETPTKEKVRQETIKELVRIKNLNKFNLKKEPPKKKKLNTSKKNIRKQSTKIILKKDTLKRTQNNKSKTVNFKKKGINRKKSGKKKTMLIGANIIVRQNKIENLVINPYKSITTLKLNTENINEEESKKNDEEINELPYTRAIILDKRSVFDLFKILLFYKLEIIYILFGNSNIKIILIGEYILSLLVNFFFNSLLYTDEVVSNKYHNNGQLDLLVTLSLSIISNIVTSIILHYIIFTKGIEARMEQLNEIKNESVYIKKIEQFLRFIKIKFICFFLSEVIVTSICYYYIVIFCIIYKNSKVSLLINYITSLAEGLITSVAMAILVLVTRKIGLSCLNKRFYNLSKYLNEML